VKKFNSTDVVQRAVVLPSGKSQSQDMINTMDMSCVKNRCVFKLYSFYANCIEVWAVLSMRQRQRQSCSSACKDNNSMYQ
jgi:hypothetical protein